MDFNVHWDGLDEFISDLGNIEKKLNKTVPEEMNRFRFIPESGAKALTPVLTNELTRSISSSHVIRAGNVFEFSIGTNLPYALKMHEWPGGWGPGTAAKQSTSWRGFTPGRKYIENAAKGSEQDFEKAMARALERALG